ncbi:hypothetical protein BDF20DRAFT_821361, partial [Mycotypha africana]|uniref:uncharacterized protein n=1 Tax=Mycotypha africana TaxID=64632 RepID=UPI00230151E3
DTFIEEVTSQKERNLEYNVYTNENCRCYFFILENKKAEFMKKECSLRIRAVDKQSLARNDDKLLMLSLSGLRNESMKGLKILTLCIC